MDEPRQGSGGGWTATRIIGLVIGAFGMAGFGLCSLCGIAISTSSRDGGGILLMFVLPGLVITFLFFLLIRAVARRARGDRPPSPR